jgi:hypothetical protein
MKLWILAIIENVAYFTAIADRISSKAEPEMFILSEYETGLQGFERSDSERVKKPKHLNWISFVA